MIASLPLMNDAATAPKLGLLDCAMDDLRAWLAERNQPPMRTKQIRRWLLHARATSFEAMTDLPKDLRPALAERFDLFSTRIEHHLTARDDTHKLVLKLHDNRMIECVLIQDDGRATACISTQVGCGMGCVFCASGINGVARNLTTGEILEQLVLLRNLTDANSTNPDRATRLTHIVVMGMGEPLANLECLLEALKIAGDKDSLGIGARHITISTVGLPAKIRQLADSGKQYHLAVSLHAPNDALRTQIVPTNTKTGIEEILSAADDFYAKTGRQVTFEYVVLGKMNDQLEHARQLARLLRGRKAYVNLIPWNNVTDLTFKRPSEADLTAFLEELNRAGVTAKVRKRRGAEIDAACGQLRREAEKGTLAPEGHTLTVTVSA